jgi:RHS repeat-associated protein
MGSAPVNAERAGERGKSHAFGMGVGYDTTPSTWLSTEYQIQPSAGSLAATWQDRPIALVQHSSTDNGQTSTSSIVVTLNGVRSGDLLTCSLTYGNAAGTTLSVSDNVNGPWAVASSVHYNSVIAQTTGQFYFANNKGGNLTITGTPGAAGSWGAMNCQEWSGVAISSALGQATQQDGTTANPSSGSVTTTASGDLVLGDLENVQAPNAGTDFTLVNTTPSTWLSSEYEIQSSSGAIAATWTAAAANWTSQVATFAPPANTWTAQVVAFKPAGGGSTVYDSGTVSLTVNGVQYSTSYGQSSTALSLATTLANAINTNGSAAVTASTSGATVYLTATTTGTSTDYSLSASSSSNESFSPPSFSATASGSALTGGSSGSTQTITTTYQYDSLNRILSKSYSDNFTPTASFVYDVTSSNGLSFTYPVGRLVEESTATIGDAGTAIWNSYDQMGRINNQWQETIFPCESSSCTALYSLPYTYDLLGRVDTCCNLFTYQYDGAGRALSVTSSYTCCGYPSTLLSGATYNAAGKEVSATLSNGVTESFTYDKRFRPLSYSAGSIYSWTIPASNGYAPNGDILAANDSVNGNWTYSYDQFNRLVGSNANSGADVYSYVYDRYGNRWQQNGPYSFLATFTGNNPANPQNNNRMDGYTYDGAGNLLNDGRHTYTYDAENRLVLVDGGNTDSYLYDAEGRRVYKASGGISTIDYDLDDHPFANGGRLEVYVGDRHLATYSNNSIYWNHTDWLGTERAHSNIGGAVAESCTSNSFGDGMTCSGSSVTPLFFTGKERDSESGLDNFEARYLGSSMGRFMSADPENLSGLINQDDPQAWNGYAYVRNNPLVYTDPGGTNYTVCDTNGKNCADLTDKQFNQYLKDNPDVSKTASGDLYVGNTKVGSASYYNEKDVAAAQFLSGPVQNVVTKAAYVVGGAMAGVYLGTAYATYGVGTTALNLAGEGGAAAPLLYKSGDIIDEVVQTSAGPVRIYGEVVVDGTKITIKNVMVYAQDSAGSLNVGVREMLSAIRPLFEGLKQAGFTAVQIVGDRISGANPGRVVDFTKTLR